MTETNQVVTAGDEVLEIRLSYVIAFLKKSRRQLLWGALAGAILGALYAYTRPNEYTSQIKVLPEMQQKNMSALGSLNSLAGLAGLDIGNAMGNNDAIRPDLYPNVLESMPFALSLLKQPVYVASEKRTQPLGTYLQETNKSSFFFGNDSLAATQLMDKPVGKDTNEVIQLTKMQEKLANIVRSRISGTWDKKTGIITITAKMQDPVVATNSVHSALTYLANYVIMYRTEKSRQVVNFLNGQLNTAKQRYQRAEESLSAYRDQNRSLYLNTAKIEEQRLQAEFLLSQELYNTLSKQAETAKIKVQEETPVFKLLEPAQVPIKKSGPQRLAIIGVSIFLGAIISLSLRLIRLLKH